MIKIGFHVSIAGGISNAPRYAAQQGYSAFQFFPSSSRSWSTKRVSTAESTEFSKISKEAGLIPFAHVPYLCNPASPVPEVLSKSRQMLVEDMNICRQLGVRYMVVHLGSHKGEGARKGIENILDTIGHALDECSEVELLLENSAGYSNSIGATFTEIGSILDNASSRRLGVCLDTCHAFAAGYDLGKEGGAERLAEEIESSIGIARVKLVHLNDAKYPAGSGLDRHWHIGKGYIGEKGFLNFFRNVHPPSESYILETPYAKEGDDTMNMLEAKKLMRKAGMKL